MGFEKSYTIDVPLDVCRKVCRLDLEIPNVVKVEDGDVFLFKKVGVKRGLLSPIKLQNVRLSINAIDNGTTRIVIFCEPLNRGLTSNAAWQDEHESLAYTLWSAFVRAAEQYRSVNFTADMTRESNAAVFAGIMPNSKESQHSKENRPAHAASVNTQTGLTRNSNGNARALKIVCVAAVIVLLIVFVFSMINSNSESVKTYTFESSGGYGGEFKLNFNEGTYAYSGNDITDGTLPLFTSSIITKSGNLYDCRETVNGRTKYNPIGMDYYIWVSADQNTISYALYTFTLK